MDGIVSTHRKQKGLGRFETRVRSNEPTTPDHRHNGRKSGLGTYSPLEGLIFDINKPKEYLINKTIHDLFVAAKYRAELVENIEMKKEEFHQAYKKWETLRDEWVVNKEQKAKIEGEKRNWTYEERVKMTQLFADGKIAAARVDALRNELKSYVEEKERLDQKINELEMTKKSQEEKLYNP